MNMRVSSWHAEWPTCAAGSFPAHDGFPHSSECVSMLYRLLCVCLPSPPPQMKSSCPTSAALCPTNASGAIPYIGGRAHDSAAGSSTKRSLCARPRAAPPST